MLSMPAPAIGLSALVGYHWEIAIGDTTLTLNEFEKFASQASPLVRIGGNWVEIRPEDVQHAIKFIQENPGGEMPLVETIAIAWIAAANPSWPRAENRKANTAVSAL